MRFFNDAQEFPALILAKFHIEVLALYLQFFRLDDIIHFCQPPPTLSQLVWGMEEKSAGFWAFFLAGRLHPFET